MPRVLRASIAVLALLLGAIIAAPAASAHTPAIRSTCEQLSVKLSAYSAKGTNSVQITVDGRTVVDETFRTGFERTVPFDFGQNSSVDWSVSVRAHDDPYGKRGWSFTKDGTQKRCDGPTTPTVPAPSAEVVCADGGVLVTLPKVDGVTWKVDGRRVDTHRGEGTVLVPVAEDAEYSIEVKAVPAKKGGSLTGQTEWTFTGVLDCEGPVEPQPEPSPSPSPEPEPEPEPVTPVAPTTEVDCAQDGVVVTLPEVEGVTWTVDGTEQPAGTVLVPVDEDATYTVVVEVTAQTGYVLEGPAKWELSGTRDCEQAPAPSPSPTVPSEVLGESVEAPDTRDSGSALPRTGSNLGWFAAAGLVLLAGGGALLMTLRSRRTDATPDATPAV